VTEASSAEPIRVQAWVHGHVQGVGFRWWTRARALELGLVGFARNLPDGRVEVVAEGAADSCTRLLDLLASEQTPGVVDEVVVRYPPVRGGLVGFTER